MVAAREPHFDVCGRGRLLDDGGVEDTVGVEVRSKVRSRTLRSCGLAQPTCDKQAENERANERHSHTTGS